MSKYLLPAFFLCLVIACAKHEEPVAEEKVESLNELPKDVRVPLKMWDMLAGIAPSAAGHGEKAEAGEHGEKHDEKAGEKAEGEHGAKAEKEAEGHGGGEEKAEGHEGGGEAIDDSYSFSDVKISFVEKNPGIVKGEKVTIAFPRGGGEIDLANYVTGEQGSFFVKFEFPEWEAAKEKKVVFISRARKRKIDNQIFGAGCKEFYNITDRFISEMSKEGLKVNTTRNRHTSVLAGTFILTAKKGHQNYLTQVTFTDSANKNLLCQEN